MKPADDQPQDSWDQRYQESERIWSGRVNAVLADIAATLPPGRALDLGSGEGADVIWLAEHGWVATGVDISSVAVQRAQTTAQARGLPLEVAQFAVADLSTWDSAATYDLVTNAFLHSHIDFDRTTILQSARRWVAPGGYMLTISHATFPPWAKTRDDKDDSHDGHDATTPESELELLQLEPGEWTVELADIRPRGVIGPEGQHVTLEDTVVLVRRRNTEDPIDSEK